MPKMRPVTWGTARRTHTALRTASIRGEARKTRKREAFWSSETTKRDKHILSLQKALQDLEREHRAAKRKEESWGRERARMAERERELRDLAERMEARLEDRQRRMAVLRHRLGTLGRTRVVFPIEVVVGAGEGAYHSPHRWRDMRETARKTGERKTRGGSPDRRRAEPRQRSFCRLL
ncbi:unnamed protein product [Lota lota]